MNQVKLNSHNAVSVAYNVSSVDCLGSFPSANGDLAMAESLGTSNLVVDWRVGIADQDELEELSNELSGLGSEQLLAFLSEQFSLLESQMRGFNPHEQTQIVSRFTTRHESVLRFYVQAGRLIESSELREMLQNQLTKMWYDLREYFEVKYNGDLKTLELMMERWKHIPRTIERYRGCLTHDRSA